METFNVKIKLSLCLTNYAYRSTYWPQHYLEVSHKLNCPAALLSGKEPLEGYKGHFSGKEPLVPFEQKSGWSSNP
jgi:hypothetical protein